MRDLFQRKAGGIWWCEFYDAAGRRARRTTHCKDRRAAALVRQRYEREAQDPSRAAEDQPVPLISEILEHFVNDGCPSVADATLSMYLQKSGHLLRLLGARRADELQDIDTMKGYIARRLEEGAASGSVQKELVTMRQALYAAMEAKQIRFNPAACFPRFRAQYRPKDRWLTPDEVIALLRVLPPHRQLWIVVAIYTGARDSEVDSLRWEDIDWARRLVHIRGTKTRGSRREVPLLHVLGSVLSRERKEAGYIVGEWGNVRRDLHAACAAGRADIPPCSPNDLRRTFATWLANEGVSEHVVAKALGHGSSQMARRVYAQLQRDLMHREIAKLSGSCTTGVPDSGPSASAVSAVSRETLGKLADILTKRVLGPGIEPGTRGFSIRAPSRKHAGLRKKKLACTTSVPRLKAVG